MFHELSCPQAAQERSRSDCASSADAAAGNACHGTVSSGSFAQRIALRCVSWAWEPAMEGLRFGKQFLKGGLETAPASLKWTDTAYRRFTAALAAQ
jgi:hypothetical protein